MGQVFIIFLILCLCGFLHADVSAKKKKKKKNKKKKKIILPQNYCFFFLVPYTPLPNFNLSQQTLLSFSSCQDHNPVLLIQFPHQLSQQHTTIFCSL